MMNLRISDLRIGGVDSWMVSLKLGPGKFFRIVYNPREDECEEWSLRSSSWCCYELKVQKLSTIFLSNLADFP
jgi:hypothetical protein